MPTEPQKYKPHPNPEPTEPTTPNPQNTLTSSLLDRAKQADAAASLGVTSLPQDKENTKAELKAQERSPQHKALDAYYEQQSDYAVLEEAEARAAAFARGDNPYNANIDTRTEYERNHPHEFSNAAPPNVGRFDAPDIDEDSETRPDPKDPHGLQLIANELGRTLVRKNAAYGDSFFKAGDHLRQLYPQGLKPDQYDIMLIQARKFDKMMRAATDNDPDGEDPFLDDAGYSILAHVLRRMQRNKKV
jgi:hypothetical protein